MKIKKRYVCKECGYTAPNWIGKCPECLSWNSLIEEIIENPKVHQAFSSNKELIKVDNILIDDKILIKSQNPNINIFFGDGIVTGSVILLAGEPGIGKSTFLLYLTKNFTPDKKIFYFSGEESYSQIKKRIERLSLKGLNLFVSNEVEIEKIFDKCKENKPDIIFVDSIQTSFSNTVDSSAGTISQIRCCTESLIRFAKENSISIFLIGHITKSGEIAGPKVVEHLVDVVLYFDSNFQNQYRVIRSVKNRFGSVDEILLFEMKENGLVLIENPSGYFIEADLDKKSIGKCKTVIIEGKRPIIVEVESLVVPSSFSNPKRFSEGVDVARINRISAILTKHLNENLNEYDIYFNISGGIKTKDVGVDLAVAVAIYSSKNKKEIPNDSIFLGELSLTGSVRNIYRLEQRIKEAKKFGIKDCYIPENSDINILEEYVLLKDIFSFSEKLF